MQPLTVNEPAVLSTTDAASAMGVSRWTLLRWSDKDSRLRSCIVRQTKHSTWWSVQRMRDAGFLTKPEPAVQL